MVEDIASEHPGQSIELWFQDEMRVGQKGTLTRVWAAKGERATAPRDLRFGYAYLFGAVCPARDTGAAIVMPMVNTSAMNEHLVEIGCCISPGAHAVLILDGAGWHPRAGLAVPANITLLFLPTYSPELNPVEELWHELRRHYLANRVIDTVEELIEACCYAWNAALHKPGFIKSVTGFSWLPPPLTAK
jgi:DDE superfamily endonuclease